jgi:hypothetical protein
MMGRTFEQSARAVWKSREEEKFSPSLHKIDYTSLNNDYFELKKVNWYKKNSFAC